MHSGVAHAAISIHPGDARTRPLTVLALVLLPAAGCQESEDVTARAVPTLVGRAVLPAASFAPGPTSGTRLGTAPINGQPVPFVDKQPIQGFSALLDKGNGTFLALSDNGFGKLEDSADFLLRRLRSPRPRAARRYRADRRRPRRGPALPRPLHGRAPRPEDQPRAAAVAIVAWSR
jgi:hypothetical protein